jgi:hypothetical protein
VSSPPPLPTTTWAGPVPTLTTTCPRGFVYTDSRPCRHRRRGGTGPRRRLKVFYTAPGRERIYVDHCGSLPRTPKCLLHATRMIIPFALYSLQSSQCGSKLGFMSSRFLKDLEYATARSTGFVVTAVFISFYRYQRFLFHVVTSYFQQYAISVAVSRWSLIYISRS